MRRLALFRARFAPLLLVLPAVHAVSSDLIRRRARLGDWSAGDSALLCVRGSRERCGVGCAAPPGVATSRGSLAGWRRALSWSRAHWRWVAKRYFYDQFDTYLNADAVLFAAAFPTSVRGQLAVHAWGLLSALVVPVVYFSVLAVVARKWMRPRVSLVAPRHIRGAASGQFSFAFVPCSFRTVQAATPDVIWFHALGGLAKRFVRGSPPHVEPGVRRPPYCLRCPQRRRCAAMFSSF